VNVGFAARDLQRDLGITATEYGLSAGLFFLGYCLFEIPSNVLLERVGARRWIARIMIGWGIVSMATMFVTGVSSFMAARVLLGIAEAGFFPGIVLYLTYWIPAAQRAKTGALFMMAAPVAVIVGAPLSNALLHLDGWYGLRGWQWLFLLEGLPAVVLGVMALFVLSDRPAVAPWLSSDERQWLTKTMDDERARHAVHGQVSIRTSLTSGRVWLLSAVFFMHGVANYGIFLWLPKLLQDVTAAEGLTLTLATSVPFIAALGAMVWVGRHSDRTGERRFHVAACAVTAATGLFLATVSQHNIWLLTASFTLSQIGLRSFAGVFWAIPPQILTGSAAAAGIALINSVGSVGGFTGPTLIGALYDATGGYTGGLLTLAIVLLLEAVLVSFLRERPMSV
jgi:ACS family tartrate transporter-like MFS transporter